MSVPPILPWRELPLEEWEALFGLCLSAPTDLTAAIDEAVQTALAGRKIRPEHACVGLAHALASFATRTRHPAVTLGAAMHIARLVIGAAPTAPDLT